MRWDNREDVGVVAVSDADAEACVKELAGELGTFAETVDNVEVREV